MPKLDFIDRIYLYFTSHPLWLRVVEWSKAHSFPGLNKIPLYNLAVFIDKENRDDAISTRANSMAFSLFMAIFPSIIVLITLLPYTPLYEMKVEVDGREQQFQDLLRSNIKEVMPGEAGRMLFDTIDDIATKPQSELLSFGFFLTIWFASNGMMSMIRGLEKTYKATFKRRTPFEKRLIAIQMTFLIGLVLVASVVFVILGNTILHFVFQYVKVDLLTRAAFFSLRWVVVLMLFYTLFSMIYRYGSSTRRPIPFFNSGAVLATPLSLLTSWGFSFYVDNFGNYNALYGSIGTLIVLMLWIQLNCRILLFGFELNAGIAVLKYQRQEKQAAEETAKPSAGKE